MVVLNVRSITNISSAYKRTYSGVSIQAQIDDATVIAAAERLFRAAEFAATVALVEVFVANVVHEGVGMVVETFRSNTPTLGRSAGARVASEASSLFAVGVNVTMSVSVSIKQYWHHDSSST